VIGKFGANTKLSNTITIEPKDLPLLNSDYTSALNKQSKISLDFRRLALNALPPTLRENVDNNLKKVVELTYDLCLTVLSDNSENDASNNINLQFFVHKAFIAERCDYFKTFLHDPFHEITRENDGDLTGQKPKEKTIAQLKLKEISAQVLVEVIYFIYSNSFSKDKLDENILYDVMLVADLYLLPSLKRKCAHELATFYLNKDNLFDLLRISRLYDLKKLEFSCINFLAMNLFDFEHSSELKDLILEDANKLKMRQETDTIDIVDDLRYAINEMAMASNLLNLNLNTEVKANPKSIKSYNSVYKSSFERTVDREMRLNLIDKILQDLNLEC
jgi:hypothetical protein